ncbi:hypothetical protein PENSUB_1929 [Penicillium subrubescens]|uniref:Uncharacterized protein n=1 Tax=Penicillium subrubescens TaxID=1316194 RepID=A0A1Q5UIY8_9EURO|nr:hypothetical protein PENSUB_1929 [Penicillium subrubescens]
MLGGCARNDKVLPEQLLLAGKPNKILGIPWDQLRDDPTQARPGYRKIHLSYLRIADWRNHSTFVCLADQPAPVSEGSTPRYQNDEDVVHNVFIEWHYGLGDD